MKAIPFPTSARARLAFESLCEVVPPELAAHAVDALERARDANERVRILNTIPELTAELEQRRGQHFAWLAEHGYATCCADCGREILPKHRCEIDPDTLRMRCMACAVSRPASLSEVRP
jgi:hypothetical protein